MMFQEPANSPAAVESSAGAEAQGRAWTSQPAALAYDYMDEEIEDVMTGNEPQVLMTLAPIDLQDPSGLD